MRLQFTRSAVRDLLRLRDCIAQHDPRAAARIGQRLVRTIRLLGEQPGLGRAVEELPGVREVVAGDQVVRYTTQDNSVVVLRVWHGRETR
jgi:plasmid stabilization system protein ParE